MFFLWSACIIQIKSINFFLIYRTSKPLIAQLMRVHVVTPKAPVHVTLNPRVQPAPSPCPIFVTGCSEPIKLSQSAYWVLRLPYPFTSIWIFPFNFFVRKICVLSNYKCIGWLKDCEVNDRVKLLNEERNIGGD